jgi:hypothetical protein
MHLFSTLMAVLWCRSALSAEIDALITAQIARNRDGPINSGA